MSHVLGISPKLFIDYTKCGYYVLVTTTLLLLDLVESSDIM